MYNYNVIIKYIVVYINTINTFQKKIINFPLKKIIPCFSKWPSYKACMAKRL